MFIPGLFDDLDSFTVAYCTMCFILAYDTRTAKNLIKDMFLLNNCCTNNVAPRPLLYRTTFVNELQ